MPWSAGPGGGFTRDGVRTWLPMADPAQCNVADQVGDPDSVLAFTRRAIARRAASDDLALGSYRSLPSPAGTWAFERGGGTVVALNMSDSPQQLEGVAGSIVLATDRAREGAAVAGRTHAGGLERGRRRAVTPRRFLLCATPAQGHAVPLLAIAGRLVGDGHQVVFFTTEHYRGKVTATGAAVRRAGARVRRPRSDGGQPRPGGHVAAGAARGEGGPPGDLPGPLTRAVRRALRHPARVPRRRDRRRHHVRRCVPLRPTAPAPPPRRGLHRGVAARGDQPRHGPVRRRRSSRGRPRCCTCATPR